ncbi:recombinase family protein [Thalassotalea psychrophila]|uniref:Recombinase family protein n=1 Tax=Thalassotalea psychrophila TaxID=3065647 RepID=A0ABY9TUH9_9GAMM|nr:recombinase family protein [Colwelliaceae bacterium SQ149]
MPNKPNCYSYIRWSSEQQGKGSSLDRQLKTAQDIAAENDLDLIEIYDRGISAFKGKNSKEGALSTFIEAVKNKQIPNDSWLVVENLDRLSREDILKAQRLFMELVELGITIVTGMDKKIYSIKSITANPMELMYSIMLFSRAHEESKTKSNRTIGNAKKIIDNHISGTRSFDGFAIAIRSIGNNMWWADCSDGTVKPHEVYFPIAQEMIELMFNSWTKMAIAKHLDNNYKPPTKSTTGTWGRDLINKFFTKRTLIGEKAITNLNGASYTLYDYYPKLIDEDKFYELQHLLKARQLHSNKAKHPHVFSGLGILYCGHCGSTMVGASTKGHLRYRCKAGNLNQNCKAWSFSNKYLEDTVIRLASNHVFNPIVDMDAKDIDATIAGVEEQLKYKKNELNNLVKAIANGNKSNTIMKHINSLELEIDEGERKLESVKAKRNSTKTEVVEWEVIDSKVLDANEVELRNYFRHKVSASITAIVCERISEGHVSFKITFINGKSITASRTQKALAFDGDAWVKLSDHYDRPVEIEESIVRNYESFWAEQEVLEQAVGDDFSVNELFDDDRIRHLSDKLIDPSEVSGINKHYKYKGLFGVNEGNSDAIEADLLRVNHLAQWANGVKGAPVIIEDQHRVYRHTDKRRVVIKPVAEVYYI